ncbi:MAG: hypothetical protein U9O94_06115 [Nanoarchaeota archaeon]|nr:hypothetical protein [Nanoarchaeota archaeon]
MKTPYHCRCIRLEINERFSCSNMLTMHLTSHLLCEHIRVRIEGKSLDICRQFFDKLNTNILTISEFYLKHRDLETPISYMDSIEDNPVRISVCAVPYSMDDSPIARKNHMLGRIDSTNSIAFSYISVTPIIVHLHNEKESTLITIKVHPTDIHQELKWLENFNPDTAYIDLNQYTNTDTIHQGLSIQYQVLRY